MFTATSAYFFMLFLIVWCYCGYLIVLVIFSSLDGKEAAGSGSPKDLPALAVIVPLYNEELLVRRKFENLKAMEYDLDRVKVYFVDGLSTDRSRDLLAQLVEGMSNWFLLESEFGGKIHQINYGLAKIDKSADIVVCTDMDAMLAPDTLVRIAGEFAADDRCAVVGANISPDETIPIEERYWQDQNLLRILESRVYTSSIVVAPCYAYRPWLVRQFPEDCVADDIYVAFKANTEGYRTRYIESVTGTEVRAPHSGAEFFQHKFRKGNAFLIELFRFFYRLPYMSGWWKVIYLTKLLQLAVIPWVLPYFLLSTISMALSGGGMLHAALFGSLFLVVAFVVTSVTVTRWRSVLLGHFVPRKKGLVMPFVVSNLIMIVVGLSFPFYRQSSRYQRLAEGGRPPAEMTGFGEKG